MTVQFTPRSSHVAPRFPNTIREYRLKAGLSQRQLGVLLGRCRSAVSLWERGLRMPSAARLFQLASELGTAPQALYFDMIRGTQRETSRQAA